MAQIYKCDFCGFVTEGIAASILISPRMPEVAAMIQGTPGVSYQHNLDGITRDACLKCVQDKFLKTAPLVIDSAKWEGEV
jgi:hypothetical protein